MDDPRFARLQVSNKNNEGVGYLLAAAREEGQDQIVLAVSCFKSALGQIQQYLGDDRMVLDDTDDDDDDSSTDWLPFLSVELPAMQDATFYIFNQAFLLRKDLATAAGDGGKYLNHPSRSTLQLISATIIFNLALSSHLAGMISKEERKVRKACELYQLCAHLVHETVDTPTGRATGIIAINNWSHIHWRFHGNRERAVELLDVMQPDITDAAAAGGGWPFDAAHLERLFINYITVHAPPTETATSA